MDALQPREPRRGRGEVFVQGGKIWLRESATSATESTTPGVESLFGSGVSTEHLPAFHLGTVVIGISQNMPGFDGRRAVYLLQFAEQNAAQDFNILVHARTTGSAFPRFLVPVLAVLRHCP